MSKKILIDSDLLKDLLEGDFLPVKVWHERRKECRKLLEESKEKRFSVLEWHDVTEAPSSNAERVFVEYSDGGFGFVFGHPEIIKDDPNYKRWSYLPE
jgi:hypothetical protein